MNKHQSERPLPRISPDNKPFWDACRDHRLLLPWCEDCARPHLPPGPLCPFCWSESIAWRPASGRGRIASWVKIHKAWFPAFAARVPYNVVLVELAEGPRLTSTLLIDAAERIDVGMNVRVAFEDLEGVTLPVFAPLSRANS